MAGPWEAYQPAAKPWEAYQEHVPAPGNVPVGTTEGSKDDIGALPAFGIGAVQGATANLGDEFLGLLKAGGGGIPEALTAGIRPGAAAGRSLVGLARLGYEYLRGEPGEATKAYETARDKFRATEQTAKEQYPGTSIAGNVTGAVAAPAGRILQAATLGGRMIRGALAGVGYGGLAGFGEGEGAADSAAKAAGGALVGAGVGAVAPPIVEGAIQGARLVGAPIVNAIRGIRDPEGEAARRIGGAIASDIRADPNATARLTPQEFAGNVQAGGPATIMDLGGDTTRALARSAANTSPEGRSVLNQTINERFEEQGSRLGNWLRHTFGSPNAQTQQEAITSSAQTANRAAYGRAYQDGDRQIWSPELERLTSSPDVVDAMREAATKGKSRAVTQGFGGFNPGVTVDNGGIVTFQRGPTGQPTYPNLQFWDYTKRALDDAANAARRSGRNEEAATLGNLSRALRTELDNQVPTYQQARAGAASFFGAENALEAGQNFVGAAQRFGLPETRRALSQMTQQERRLFQDGYVSRLIERMEATGDRRNVLNQIGQSPAARQELEIALGPQRARELEAVLRVEGVMDTARSAVQGNSTTARQLVELGLAGGAGGLSYLNSDPSAAVNAALVWGAARGHRAIDARVAQRVANMLTSNDPQVLVRGVQMVARNNRLMDQFRRVDLALSRAGTQQAPTPVLQAPGIGRANDDQPAVPRPPAQ